MIKTDRIKSLLTAGIMALATLATSVGTTKYQEARSIENYWLRREKSDLINQISNVQQNPSEYRFIQSQIYELAKSPTPQRSKSHSNLILRVSNSYGLGINRAEQLVSSYETVYKKLQTENKTENCLKTINHLFFYNPGLESKLKTILEIEREIGITNDDRIAPAIIEYEAIKKSNKRDIKMEIAGRTVEYPAYNLIKDEITFGNNSPNGSLFEDLIRRFKEQTISRNKTQKRILEALDHADSNRDKTITVEEASKYAFQKMVSALKAK